MILNEEKATAYAEGLIKKVLSKDIRTDEQGKGFGGTYNRERLTAGLKVKDFTFNYNNADTFANDVYQSVLTKTGNKYKRLENIIKDISRDYATAKIAQVQQNTNNNNNNNNNNNIREESYFNY